MFRALICCLVLLHLVHGEALTDTWFVDNLAGSDTNNGGMSDNQGEGIGPLKSIGAALKKTRRGDRIELANNGVAYRECITLQGGRNSGYATRPFVIVGNGATLDGSAPVPPRWQGQFDGTFHFQPERTWVSGVVCRRQTR